MKMVVQGVVRIAEEQFGMINRRLMTHILVSEAGME